MTFTARIRTIQKRQRSLLCLGLDPDPRKLPSLLRGRKHGVRDFCRAIIEVTHDLVCAYKINLAFFEALGTRGADLLADVAAMLPGGTIRIADGKRGDIGNTATMYAHALFDQLPFDAVTVNPYMGTDAVEPFLVNKEKGAFVLALTSNPGAQDFQYLRAGRRPLYEQVVLTAQRWNVRRNCGLVVGATRPVELRRVRSLAPDMPVLIPGVGAQGGDLRAAIRHGCTSRGDLALINVGRTILYASGGKDFATAARNAAVSVRDEIARYRRECFDSR